MARLEDYQNRFKHVRLVREDGILEVTIHRDRGPALWEAMPGGIHDQLGQAFYLIGRDPETKVVILTGAGDAFCAQMDPGGSGSSFDAGFWSRIIKEGKDLLTNLLDIDVPVIGAVNGDALLHAELAVLSDIVLAAEGARFADKAHAIHGVVPGDGVHVIWPMLLGPNRGRHFLLTGAEITAEQALELGVVAEVLPRDQLKARAWELARELAKKPRAMLSYTRLALTHELKRRLLNELSYGLTLEALAAHP